MKNTIIVCLIGILSLTTAFYYPAFAADSPTKPYLFMKDWITTCGYIKSSVDRIKTKQERREETDKTYLVTMTMKDFRAAISDIQQAKLYLDKYKDDKNKSIGDSSRVMRSALDLLIGNYENTMKLYDKLYFPESMKEPDAGKIMSDMSKLAADRDEILKLCMQSSVAATYSLISDKQDSSGQSHSLTITSKERDALKEELVKLFGKDIKVGLKAGQSLSITPASVLYEFLKRETNLTTDSI